MIIVPKTSTYIKSHNDGAKQMHFLIKFEKLLNTHREVGNSVKNEFERKHIYNKKQKKQTYFQVNVYLYLFNNDIDWILY